MFDDMNGRDAWDWAVKRHALIVYPQHRVGINGALVPELAHWLHAFSARYRKVLTVTGRGLGKRDRAKLRGSKTHARMMLRLCEAIRNAMLETVDLRDVDESRRLWDGIESANRGE